MCIRDRFNIVDLNLQGYNGGIGFKFGLGNNFAIQTGLDFGFSENKSDVKDDPDNTYQSGKSFGIFADIVKYSPLKKNLKIYYGGGFAVDMRYSRYHSTSSDGIYFSVNDEDVLSASLRGILGFEYELNQTFSLGFQQIISASYSNGTGKDGFGNMAYGDSTEETEIKNFGVGLGSTYLSLFFYF
jgi:hypothetical protein